MLVSLFVNIQDFEQVCVRIVLGVSSSPSENTVDSEKVNRVLFPSETVPIPSSIDPVSALVSSDDETTAMKPIDPEETPDAPVEPEVGDETVVNGPLAELEVKSSEECSNLDMNFDVAAGPEALNSPFNDGPDMRAIFQDISVESGSSNPEHEDQRVQSEKEIDENVAPLYRSFNSQGGIDFVAGQTLDGSFRQHWLLFVCDDRLLCRALRVLTAVIDDSGFTSAFLLPELVIGCSAFSSSCIVNQQLMLEGFSFLAHSIENANPQVHFRSLFIFQFVSAFNC